MADKSILMQSALFENIVFLLFFSGKLVKQAGVGRCNMGRRFEERLQTSASALWLSLQPCIIVAYAVTCCNLTVYVFL